MKPILEVRGLGKRYQIQHLKAGYLNLRERIQSPFQFNKEMIEDFWALRNVSFDVKSGESIGIIGRNGAGKSTLLKILSKITKPTEGEITLRGRVASLLEVGTGFHPELTGRENVFFNGALLGMTHIEIQSKFDEMIDFSGVENFLDTPLKHYSSGMQLRLAFAVAAFLEPEILLIDEVLAVGDAEFQKKCLGKMEDVSKSGRTILFVSHNLGAVIQLCRNSMLLEKGKSISMGSTNDVIADYLSKSDHDQVGFTRKEIDKDIFIESIRPFNSKNVTKEFRHNESISFEFKIQGLFLSAKYRLLVIVLDELKKRIFSAETMVDSQSIKLFIEPGTLVRGRYSLTSIIYIPGITQYDVVEDECSFTVIDGGSIFAHLADYDYGVVFAKTQWTK